MRRKKKPEIEEDACMTYAMLKLLCASNRTFIFKLKQAPKVY